MQVALNLSSNPAELIEQSQREAEASLRPFLEVLQERLGLSSEAFLSWLGQHTFFDTIDIHAMHQLTFQFEAISFSLAQKKECLLGKTQYGAWHFIFANPFDSRLMDWATRILPTGCVWRLAHQKDILAVLSLQEDSMRALDGMQASEQVLSEASDIVAEISMKTINEESNPIVKVINSTLYDALKSQASDIHLESVAQGLAIKYRIDGVMASISHVQGSAQADQAISRVKVMAQLDISERRIPQDGRFKVLVQGREVDFRVSIMPSVYGEDAVLRVLDRKALTESHQALTLQSLGFNAETIAQFRKLASEPYGMVLVTGPTGSGKTTSLYAAISEVNSGYDKIITIEDPVEYQLPGVLQIPVNEKKGLTFARGLRSILRHDPDKIMVGEIRDGETAQIAVQAALTGHLVFSTVHANSVLDVVGRFMHMGVDPYNFVSAVNGIMAQRLVRSLCPHCAEVFEPSEAMLSESGIEQAQASGMQFKQAKGCGHCRGTGYRGRRAIAELLVLNDELREMIVARAPIRALKDAAKRQGMRSMREASLMEVAAGRTSLQEVNRVTFVA